MCGHGPPVEKPNFNVVCIGLSKSGKSTLLSVLSGESTDNIEPTIGMYTFHKYVQFFSFVYITGYAHTPICWFDSHMVVKCLNGNPESAVSSINEK